MRACYVVLAIAVALISSSDALPTAISPQQHVVSSAGVGRSTANNNRFLKLREAVDDADEDSDDEERGLPSVASEKATSSMSRLFSAADDLKKIEDDIVKLKPELSVIKNENKELFKQIKGQGYTPDSMSQKLGIEKKLETMTEAQLLDDANYLLWLKFSSWWKKNKPE